MLTPSGLFLGSNADGYMSVMGMGNMGRVSFHKSVFSITLHISLIVFSSDSKSFSQMKISTQTIVPSLLGPEDLRKSTERTT